MIFGYSGQNLHFLIKIIVVLQSNLLFLNKIIALIITFQARHTTGPEPKLIAYDGDNEKRRKEQAKRLFDRTGQQVEEEANLLQELRKIEARKKDRERKTQDLQKLITAADGGSATGAAETPNLRGTPPDKKQQVRKKTPFATPKAKLELMVTISCYSSIRSNLIN